MKVEWRIEKLGNMFCILLKVKGVFKETLDKFSYENDAIREAEIMFEGK